MKRVMLLVLTLIVAIAAAVIHWGPVKEYVIVCERASRVTCILERTKATGTRRWEFQPGPGASAAVRIVPRRRGNDSVYLYLESAPQDVFAAEFEGANATGEAASAASQLNKVFKSTGPALARIVVRPPEYLHWLSWGAVVFTALLILAAYRHLRSRERSSKSLEM